MDRKVLVQNQIEFSNAGKTWKGIIQELDMQSNVPSLFHSRNLRQNIKSLNEEDEDADEPPGAADDSKYC